MTATRQLLLIASSAMRGNLRQPICKDVSGFAALGQLIGCLVHRYGRDVLGLVRALDAPLLVLDRLW